jgi:hypothetical protein
MKITPKPSHITERAAVDPAVAEQVWLKVLHEEGEMPPIPWAAETDILGQRFVVGMGVPEFYTVFPLPFSGHMEEWQVIPPINSAADLLKVLKGE